VVAIVILPVLAFVWIARRVRARRERLALEAEERAASDAQRYEERVIADMERRIQQ
jgi:hypothetical protein